MKKVIIILVVICSGYLSGCKSNKIIMGNESSPQNKTAGPVQQDVAVDYDEAVKRHFDMQSDRTKLMMINSEKKSKNRNYGLNRTWYDQLFNNSCMNNSCMVKTGHQYQTITKRTSCFIKR